MKPQSVVLLFTTANSVRGSGERPAFASHSMSFKYNVRSRSNRKVRDVQNITPYKSHLNQRFTIGLIPQAKINGNSVESDVDEKLPFFAMDDDYNDSQKSSYLTSDKNYHFNLEQAQSNPVFQVFNKVMVSRNQIFFLDSESTGPDLHYLHFLSRQFLVEKFKKELIKQILKEHGSLPYLHSFWLGLIQ